MFSKVPLGHRVTHLPSCKKRSVSQIEHSSELSHILQSELQLSHTPPSAKKPGGHVSRHKSASLL